MIKSIHKIFIYAVLFFTAILFSEKSFAQTNTCSGTYTFGAGNCNEIQIGAGIAGSSIRVCLVTNNITGGVCNPGGACNPPFSGGGWSPRITIFRLPLTSEATWTSATANGTCYTLTSTDGYAILDGLCSVSGTVISWTTIPGPTVTTISPTSTSVCSGGSTTLTAAGGFSTIQWQSSPNNSTWTNIGGATSGTYVTPGLTSTTYYRATYTDPCVSGTTNTTTVTIASAPVFSAQPANGSVCQGSSTIMSVVVTPASATYQWQYFNGAWANVANGTPANFTYSNQTTANLTVSTTTSAAAGSYLYRCNVTACASTVSSSSATLTVNALPNAGSITPLSTSGTCAAPPSFTLTLGGGYTGTIQWQSSPDNTNWTNIYGATSASYSGTASATTYYRTIQTLNSCTRTQASTATVTVTGTTTKTFNVASGAWGTAANWSPSGVPATCDDVIIPSGRSVTVGLDAYCHNLTVDGTLTITFSSGKYLRVSGNFTNNGTTTQSAASSSNPQGQCSPCSGLSLEGKGTWTTNNNNYPLLTVAIGDGSDITMIGNATIEAIDATKTVTAGKLNLSTATLKVVGAISQSGSEMHVNTGLLWIAITRSMLIDQTTLYPEYGTVFNDLGIAATLTISGAWNTIGGTGWYNYEQRAQLGGSTINNNCNFVCRGYYKVWPGSGTISTAAGGNWTNEVKGDFINEGTWVHNSTNTVLMSGPGLVYDPLTNTYITSTATQNITGPSVTTFTNLTVNNSGTSVTLNGVDANVSNVLTLTNAPLYLNSQRLTVTNAVPAAITRTNGYVVSETNLDVNPSILQWNIGTDASAHIIPFGTAAGDYIPVTFDGSGASGNISFSTRPTASNNSPWAGTSNVTAVNTMVCALDPAGCELETAIDRWWDITSSAASPLPAVNLSLTYRGSENTTTATGNVGFQHWTGTTWNDGKGGAAGTWTDSGVLPSGGTQTVNGTGFTEFSPYILMRGSAPLPLPVELISFSADCKGDKVIAEWETASEINNDYFTLEKSTDGSTFYPIAKIPGAGNSSTTKKYSAEDMEPFSAAAYYRLSQTDYDSKTTSFDIVAVKGCGNDEITAYSSGSVITVNVNSKKESRYNIVLLDAQGKVVLTRTEFFAAGNNQSTFPVTADNGIYVLKVFNDKNIRVQKVSIQK